MQNKTVDNNPLLQQRIEIVNFKTSKFEKLVPERQGQRVIDWAEDFLETLEIQWNFVVVFSLGSLAHLLSALPHRFPEHREGTGCVSRDTMPLCFEKNPRDTVQRTNLSSSHLTCAKAQRFGCWYGSVCLPQRL